MVMFKNLFLGPLFIGLTIDNWKKYLNAWPGRVVCKVPPQDQDIGRADRDVRVIGRELEELSHCPSASLMILGQPWLSQPFLEQRGSCRASLQRNEGAARRMMPTKKSWDLKWLFLLEKCDRACVLQRWWLFVDWNMTVAGPFRGPHTIQCVGPYTWAGLII